MIVNDAVITSGYGNRILNGEPQFHHGIDIVSADRDSRVYSPFDGIVVYDFDNYNDAEKLKAVNSGGNYLIIKYIQNEKIFYLKFLHLINNFCDNHEKVLKGQYIGTYGNVGISFGAHLHISAYFENWTVFNPLTVLDGEL